MDREKEEEAIAFAPIFHKILDHQPLPEEEEDVYEDEEEEVARSDSSSEDFEFSFAPNFQEDTESSVEDLADGIFSNGQIGPVYPAFNRKLVEEREDLKELELSFRRVLTEDDREETNEDGEKRFKKSVPAPESYCEWIPKSRSTGGSSSRKWNLMDLVIGRSHSDGKQKFLFLSPPVATASNTDNTVVDKKKKKKKKKKKEEEEVRVREMDMVTAHKLYYGREGGVGERKQQSYLPYRRNLVGFPFRVL